MRVDRSAAWRLFNFAWIVCPACGSLFPRASRLCAFCEDRVVPVGGSFERTSNGLSVRSLFRWNPGESDRLSRLILSLKGRKQREAWHFWAGEFFRQHAESIPALANRNFVCGPARAGVTKPDHSFYWGEALAADFGAEFAGQLFEKEGSSRTRKLSWGERWARAPLKARREIAFDPDQRWVFVDDVFTTGATARAVHRGLGYPEHFEVWVLADRTRREHDFRSSDSDS